MEGQHGSRFCMARYKRSDYTRGSSDAAKLIREKVARIYAEEPDAKEELAEAQEAPHRSKHQQFMYQLSTSGKDLATIQTEWHNYYQRLPAHERHQVWHEFYASQASITGQPAIHDPQALAQHKQQAAKPKSSHGSSKKKLRDARSREEVQAAIRDSVTAGGKLKAKHHIQSLLFGLGMGFLAIVILLFGFFNEVIIAPFIQPSRVAASTPLIVNESSIAATKESKVIIPKINVEIPVDYNQTTITETDMQNALENGVVHYPTTTRPGETGNAAFFGHSSNNIFNKGKYKFAFVLLHTLVEGDTFYLTYDGKVYVYKVTSKQVVDPSNVGVLDPIPGKTAAATLITCDPPGTSLRRLVVVGEQISPDPAGNSAPAAIASASSQTEPTTLPGNSPTLWSRIIKSPVGKAVLATVAVVVALTSIRWVNRRLLQKLS